MEEFFLSLLSHSNKNLHKDGYLGLEFHQLKPPCNLGLSETNEFYDFDNLLDKSFVSFAQTLQSKINF